MPKPLRRNTVSFSGDMKPNCKLPAGLFHRSPAQRPLRGSSIRRRHPFRREQLTEETSQPRSHGHHGTTWCGHNVTCRNAPPLYDIQVVPELPLQFGQKMLASLTSLAQASCLISSRDGACGVLPGGADMQEHQRLQRSSSSSGRLLSSLQANSAHFHSSSLNEVGVRDQ